MDLKAENQGGNYFAVSVIAGTTNVSSLNLFAEVGSPTEIKTRELLDQVNWRGMA